jgi:hypothetical protein
MTAASPTRPRATHTITADGPAAAKHLRLAPRPERPPLALVKVPRGTEAGDAPGWQGVRRENMVYK